MNNQDQLFQAIEKITRTIVENNPSSKMVKGIIISETVDSDGAYKISYLDSTIKAFPQNESLKYKEGELVYIILPNGKLNDKNIILNTAENRPDTAPDVDSSIQDAIDQIVTTGKNYILTPKEEITLTKNNLTYPITIDEIFYRHYMTGQSHIRLKANIESEISRAQIGSDFDFGIEITIEYEDKSSRTFDFNYLSMEGNVYHLIGNAQDLIFEVPVGVKPINAYGKLYLKNPSQIEADYVKFSNLKLELLSDLLTDIITSKKYEVKIYSPSGSIFDSAENKVVKLTCQVISDTGIEVDPWGMSFSYEWYVITFDEEGNKIRPAFPTHREKELMVDLSIQDSGVKHYECDVYPKESLLIKKLDIK